MGFMRFFRFFRGMGKSLEAISEGEYKKAAIYYFSASAHMIPFVGKDVGNTVEKVAEGGTIEAAFKSIIEMEPSSILKNAVLTKVSVIGINEGIDVVGDLEIKVVDKIVD